MLHTLNASRYSDFRDRLVRLTCGFQVAGNCVQPCCFDEGMQTAAYKAAASEGAETAPG